MKYQLLYFFLFLISFSHYQKKLTDSQCQEITEIYESDQSIRLDSYKNTSYYSSIFYPDLKGEKYKMKRESNTRKLFYEYVNSKKNIEEIVAKYKSDFDEESLKSFLLKEEKIYSKMFSVDSTNLRKVKYFLNKYGYPNENRFENKCEVAKRFHYVIVHLINVKEIDSLIQKERRLGRFPEKKYWIVSKRKEFFKKYKKN